MLPAVSVRGTMRLLRPSAFHLSPAIGLVAASSPIFSANLYRAGDMGPLGFGYGAAIQLSREILHTPTQGEVRLSRSLSRAAAYVSPVIAGHILGLSLSNASAATVNSTLHSLGVRTNRIHGQWTGVSLARFRRLIAIVRAGVLESASTPALPLLLRCVWERARSRQCLLDYVLALDSHTPVLAPEFATIREDPAVRDKWLRLHFEPDELSDRHIDASALLVLQSNDTCDDSPPPPPLELADALERIAVSLAQE